MNKIVVMVIVTCSILAFSCRAPINEFSYGGKSFRQRRETLSTINAEISRSENKIKKSQQEIEDLLEKASKASPEISEKYFQMVLEKEENISLEKNALASMYESKEKMFNNFIDSEGGIYSGNINEKKVKAAAEAYAMLSFIDGKESGTKKNLKAVFLNESYYTVNVKVALGDVWMTEFNLLRRDGVQEIEIPSYGDYTITLTKGTGPGSSSSVLIKRCKPGITYLFADKKYDLMVTCLR